ncbi:MAG: hypothetical protein P8174_11420, partial [Gemmatimonadota bacterium]
LCFSELSDDELDYTLTQVVRILKPGGLLLVADEVRPRGPLRRMLHAAARAPLVVLAWLLTQQTTHAVTRLPERVEAAGLSVMAVRTNRSGSFAELVARRPPADDDRPRHGNDASDAAEPA